MKTEYANNEIDRFTPLGRVMTLRSVSREELARKSGVSKRTITYIMRGRRPDRPGFIPTADTLVRLCRVLRCQPEDIWPVASGASSLSTAGPQD